MPDELDRFLDSEDSELDSFLDSPGQPGMFGKAWEALKIPEQMSREGLGQLASMVPQGMESGNVPLDLLTGAPRVAAETLAEAAPGFISRGSIATAGLLRSIPYLQAAGGAIARPLGRWAESISGLEYKTPGILAEAAKDPTLIFGKGRESVKPLYSAIKKSGAARPEISLTTERAALLDESKKAYEAGTMTPQEALIARRNLDKMKNSVPADAFATWRDRFDQIAKRVSETADAAFVRAIKSEALQNALPVNKTGGTSIFKSVLGTMAQNPSKIPLLPFMSPYLQGMAASAMGGANTLGNLSQIPEVSQSLQYGAAVSTPIYRVVAGKSKSDTEQRLSDYYRNAR